MKEVYQREAVVEERDFIGNKYLIMDDVDDDADDDVDDDVDDALEL